MSDPKKELTLKQAILMAIGGVCGIFILAILVAEWEKPSKAHAPATNRAVSSAGSRSQASVNDKTLYESTYKEVMTQANRVDAIFADFLKAGASADMPTTRRLAAKALTDINDAVNQLDRIRTPKFANANTKGNFSKGLNHLLTAYTVKQDIVNLWSQEGRSERKLIDYINIRAKDYKKQQLLGMAALLDVARSVGMTDQEIIELNDSLK